MVNSQITTTFGMQDWQTFYTSMGSPDLSSFDFSTLRKSFINYLQLKNPENFNDFIESSEFVSLVDLIAFMGQSMSFRFDMNTRENFLSTAQSRNSINYLANLVNYVPSRNLAANGFLKITNISINDNIFDSLGNNLNGIIINWNDRTNRNWQDQWNSILNAVLTSSQTIGNPGNTNTINGINYSEYGIGVPTSQPPPYAFNAMIDNSSMNFEAVNPTSIGESYIYEVAPNDSSTFNLLYENDSEGFSSQNTGYFLYFKQGTLSSQTFSMSSALPNTTVSLSQTGVNNSDVWLYKVNGDGSLTEWTQVQSIYGENTTFNNLSSSNQTIFSITNQSNDSITLVFGDGVFGAIPSGNFICYMRSSNGLTYQINPVEMSNLSFNISYTSKSNRTQILTVQASLQYTIGNSAGTESLANIKLKAPQNFYSQNRMVNGQDYNSFPFTQYSNLLQVKAINRSSSGVSRYLDVVDPTGKYSSTNVFCDDGFIYIDPSIITNNYTYANQNALASIVENQISTIVASSNILSFIFNNYDITSPTSSTKWNLVLTDNTSCSGWISDETLGTLITINDGRFAPLNYSSILAIGSILKFTAPSGYAFDINNNLVANSGSLLINQNSTIYASITNSINAGIGNSIDMNGVNVDGSGAITISAKIPTGAILSGILPLYNTTLSSSLIQKLINYLIAGNAIALSYNSYNFVWSIDNTLPLNYSPATYGTTFIPPYSSSASVTNDWLLAFVPGSSTNNFTVYQRSNAYYFGSEQQTTFYYDSNAKVYDPVNSTILSDQISILNTNSAPGTILNTGFPENIPVDVYATVNEIDGSINSGQVQIQYADLLSTGIPSDPFFFNQCVSNSYIFFVTNNSQSTTTLISSGSNQVVIVNVPTDINNNLYSYANGAIIFCISNSQFYKISRVGSVASKSTLNNSGDTLTYSYYRGRQDLKFQYQHNASDSRRIDPSPSNIIDLYCLESSYASAYQQYISDQTGQITEPNPPTTDTLSNDFAGLANYKMISDELIFNSAQFIPLFGSKADTSLQATFVVVSNPNITVGSGEIASQVITYVNNFFTIGNFSFGQTFYWAQLSNYIINNMSTLINAINLVPAASNLSYGALEQITCNPYEIFISSATVQNVSVVTSLDNLNLKIS